MMLKILIFCKYFYIVMLCLIPMMLCYEWRQEGFSFGILFSFAKASVVFTLLLFLSKYIISLNFYK